MKKIQKYTRCEKDEDIEVKNSKAIERVERERGYILLITKGK